MTSFAPSPPWEVDNNPKLTYPIVTRFGIREMTCDQIRGFAKRIGTPEERIGDLEAQVARQHVMIENIAKAMSLHFSSRSNPNA